MTCLLPLESTQRVTAPSLVRTLPSAGRCWSNWSERLRDYLMPVCQHVHYIWCLCWNIKFPHWSELSSSLDRPACTLLLVKLVGEVAWVRQICLYRCVNTLKCYVCIMYMHTTLSGIPHSAGLSSLDAAGQTGRRGCVNRTDWLFNTGVPVLNMMYIV